MKIDLSKKIVSLDGKTEYNEMGDYVSELLVQAKTESPLKLYELALQAKNEHKLEVDTTDYELVLGIIEKAEQYNNLVKAQIILQMKGSKHE